MFASHPPQDADAPRGAPWLWTVVVLAIGLTVTAAAWHWERQNEARRIQRELEYRAANFTSSLRAELMRYERILAAARAVQAAQPLPTRDTWRQFAASLDLARNYPAILAVAWQPRVAAAELPRMASWAARENGVSLDLRPPGARETYFPAVLIEPRTWRNERLLGLDDFADPARRTAMERARDEASVTLTPPVTLALDADQKSRLGFLMVAALYGGGQVPAGVDERQRRHAGYVVVSFRIVDLVQGVLAREYEGMDLTLGVRGDGGRLLFGSESRAAAEGLADTIAFGGQVLELGFRFQPEQIAAQGSGRLPLIVLAGLVVTLLATLLIWHRTHALVAIERRAREIAAELSESEERYSLATETTTDGLWEHDLRTGKTRVSPRFEALLGYAPGSFERLGLDPASLVHPADRFRQRETLMAHIKHHAPYVCELRMRAADGRYVWAHTHGRALRNDAGRAVRLIGSIADVTELHAALDRFRDLTRLASDWFWEQDANYRFTAISESAGARTSVSPGEAIGKTRWELATGCDPEKMAAHRALVEAHQSFREFEYCVVSDKGETWWYSVNGKPVFDDNGRFVGYRGTSRDVTMRKRLEEELRRHRDNLSALVEAQTADLVRAKDAAEQASRSKSEFLANMSHELRTPMHAILSFARIGRDRLATAAPEKLAEYFDRILQSGDRLLEMVNSLLDLSKLEAGKMPLDATTMDLAAVVAEVVHDMDAMVEARRVRVEGSGADGDTVIHGDARRLAQVVRNLLSNAIKFAPEGSRVDVEFVADELPAGRRAADVGMLPALRMTIADEGPGIPDDEREAIFEKFYQSSATRTGAGGTGLGLAICREIVEAHRGTIRARNRPEGGAAFDTVLPRGNRE